MVEILFFAWCRERLGCDRLAWELTSPITVETLKRQLAARGERWEDVLCRGSVLVAVNQTLAHPHSLIQPGDEVAFFPPVTGG